MVRMFCTVQEAAEKLAMTEAELDAMIDDGGLREFRDGDHRFVKVAELSALAVRAAAGMRPTVCVGQATANTPASAQRRAAPTDCAAPRAATRRRPPAAQAPSRPTQQPTVLQAAEIRLPLSAAATANRSRSAQARTAGQVSQSARPHAAANRWAAHHDDACRYDTHLDTRHIEAIDAPHTATDRRRPAWRAPAAPRHNQSRTLPAPAFTAKRLRPPTHEMSLRQWLWTGLLDDRPDTILVLLATLVVGVCGVATAVYLVTRVL